MFILIVYSVLLSFGISDSYLSPPRIRNSPFSSGAGAEKISQSAAVGKVEKTNVKIPPLTQKTNVKILPLIRQAENSTTQKPQSQNPIVKIGAGQLQGKLVNTERGNTAYCIPSNNCPGQLF